jgi:hypothetical protein
MTTNDTWDGRVLVRACPNSGVPCPAATGVELLEHAGGQLPEVACVSSLRRIPARDPVAYCRCAYRRARDIQ